MKNKAIAQVKEHGEDNFRSGRLSKSTKVREVLGCWTYTTPSEVARFVLNPKNRKETDYYRKVISEQKSKLLMEYEKNKMSRKLIIQFLPFDEKVPCIESFIIQYRVNGDYNLNIIMRATDVNAIEEDTKTIVDEVLGFGLSGELKEICVWSHNLHFHYDEKESRFE